ncbi:PREDICTED: extensin-like [Nicotiana attenuata]|uniref:Uncharacterized protein n=1 Tax=Nicotiana attenuata TaxID=49451 RepID=A0A314KU69_NICAT|nr:PREDICTED: extensin-like [Nicotiana attenuata]OIT32812.1 hypothetical protein A4A49_18905 [Nicotiana attenuata]
MKHAKVLSLALMTTKWSILLLCVTFSLANSHDTNTPAGLLCISDCSTCPVICSPPPSPIKLKPPPSPSSVLVQAPPPPPPLFAPLRPSPSQSSPRSPSPSSSQPSPKSPPPSYITYTAAPPPPSHSSNCPTPPNIINIPATQAPPANGQKNYPYYYFYVSKATSFPLHGSIIIGFLVVFHFLCICW